MRWYLTPWVGDGSDESPFVPAGSEHLASGWGATDGRMDIMQPGESALLECNPTQAEHEALMGTEGVEYLGEDE